MGDLMNELLGRAEVLRQTKARRTVAAETASAAVREAIESARDLQAEVRASKGTSTLRQHLRSMYWRVVDRGAWWLVPLLERARQLACFRAF